MFLKRFFNKIWFLIKQNKFWIISSIICSVLLFLYLILFVQEFGEKHYFYSEGISPEKGYKLQYFIITTPFTILFFIVVKNFLKTLNILRTLIYPMLLITSYISLYFTITIFGGEIGLLFLYTLPIALFMMIISTIWGLFLDIKTIKNTNL